MAEEEGIIKALVCAYLNEKDKSLGQSVEKKLNPVSGGEPGLWLRENKARGGGPGEREGVLSSAPRAPHVGRRGPGPARLGARATASRAWVTRPGGTFGRVCNAC